MRPRQQGDNNRARRRTPYIELKPPVNIEAPTILYIPIIPSTPSMAAADYKDSDGELIHSVPSLLLSLTLATSTASLNGYFYVVEKLAPAPATVLKITVTSRGLLGRDGPVADIVRRQLRVPVAELSLEPAPVVAKARDPRINPDFLRQYALDRRARDNLLLMDVGKVPRYLRRFHYRYNVYRVSQLLTDKLWERVTLPPRGDPCPPRGVGQLPRTQSMRKGAVPPRWVTCPS